MKNEVCKKLEGYMVYNKCMPYNIDYFHVGHNTVDDPKEMCEKYIAKHHPNAKIYPVKATVYYEIPEDKTFCNKGEKCGENICFCDEK